MNFLRRAPAHMSIHDGIILFFAAAVAGVINSVAGGGSFITFPTLLFLGVPAIPATATNTVALWPGSIASAAAYWRELYAVRKGLLLLSIVSVVGGYIGAHLLLSMSENAFRTAIPWLLLVATAVFILGPLFARKSDPGTHEAGAPVRQRHPIIGAVVQFAIAVYGGLFAGGIGMLMLAAQSMLGMDDIQVMNGLKNWLATCIKGVAVVTFIVSGAVFWGHAVVMVVGGLVGGYYGAATARKLDPKLVRGCIILIGVVLTIYFFVEG